MLRIVIAAYKTNHKQLAFDDQIVKGLIVLMGEQDIVTDTCREDPEACDQPKTTHK